MRCRFSEHVDMKLSRRLAPTAPSAAADPVPSEIPGLASVADALTGLVAGLEAMAHGDLRHEASLPLPPTDAPPAVVALNATAGAAVEAYNLMREQLRGALGDRSSLQ